jgi:hypothetical protein
MDKDKINSKIEDLEAELQKLKQLAKQPEKRTPEVGDVWEDSAGFVEFIAIGGQGVDLGNGHISFKKFDQYQTHSSDTYLGKFDEVYVNRAEFIADVRDALSIEVGNEVSFIGMGTSGWNNSYNASRKALRKLNIITD